MATELEVKPFPETGRTLIINGIGQKTTAYVSRFIQYLEACGGLEEVLGVSLFGVSAETEAKINNLFQDRPIESIRPARFWEKFFERPTEQVFVPSSDLPPVILNNTERAAEELIGKSNSLGDSARAIISFISYERGADSVIPKVLADYKQYLPDLEHYGVILVPPGTVIEKANFDNLAGKIPVESLGLPIILMDDVRNKDLNIYDKLAPEDAILVGLSGLISNRRAFPNFNRHNYLELLQALVDKSHLIGVNIFQRTEMAEFILDRAEDYDQRSLVSYMSHDLDSTDQPDTSYTSLHKLQEGSLDIVTMQLPIPPNHKFWQNNDFRYSLDITRSRCAQKQTVFSVGSLKSRPVGKYGHLQMVTSRFYPTEMIMGWHVIMKLVEDL